jgi:hypothetical protein
VILKTVIISLNSINKIFVVVVWRACVFVEVGAKILSMV